MFFSYATCGTEERSQRLGFSGQEPAPGCECVGIDDKAGSIRFSLDGHSLRYPAETGGSCEARLSARTS